MTEKDFLKRVGSNIRAERKKKGFTQTDIRELGITAASNLSHIERGRTGSTLLTLKKLSDTFGIDIKKFFK